MAKYEVPISIRNANEFHELLARSNAAYEQHRDEAIFQDHYAESPETAESNRTAEGIIFGFCLGCVMWIGIICWIKLASML